MNGSNTVMDQDINENNNVRGSAYVATDGILRYCITAPLLELPVDFKEWYKPARINTPQFSSDLKLAS